MQLMLRSVIVIIISALACSVFAAEETHMQFVRRDAALPPYVLIVADQHSNIYDHLPDSVFNELAGNTIFKVNRTELNLKDPFLRELIDSVLPMARAKEWMLVGIDLRGAASPEGPYANNERLGRGRSRALIDFMSSQLDSVQLSSTHTINVAEDYPYLLWLLEQDGDASADELRQIISRHGADNCEAIKRDLQKAQGGDLWKRLLRDYFPRLRSARVVLFFKRIYPEKITDKVVTVIAPVPHFDFEAPEISRSIRDVSTPEESERRHVLAVSTNLLYDAFYMPQFGWAPMLNAQLEYFPSHGNFTFLAGYTGPYYHRWHRNKFFQIRDYHLEVRRYFNPGDRHLGCYLAAYANANKYGIGLSATKGWQGEGWGGALKVGYVLPLGHGRWRLDLHAAIGGYVTRYDPYVYGNPITGETDGDYYYDWTLGADQFKKRNHRFSWIGPTEVGVSLAFDLLYKKKK